MFNHGAVFYHLQDVKLEKVLLEQIKNAKKRNKHFLKNIQQLIH